MRATEFLRAVLDMLDSVENHNGQEVVDQPAVVVAEPHQAQQTQAGPQAHQDANGTVDDNVGTFVPPLQTKIELLKKSADVKSVFDPTDELAHIKQTAGIIPIHAQEAGDDDGPFEG